MESSAPVPEQVVRWSSSRSPSLEAQYHSPVRRYVGRFTTRSELPESSSYVHANVGLRGSLLLSRLLNLTLGCDHCPLLLGVKVFALFDVIRVGLWPALDQEDRGKKEGRTPSWVTSWGGITTVSNSSTITW
jgi:hypothetical protein